MKNNTEIVITHKVSIRSSNGIIQLRNILCISE